MAASNPIPPRPGTPVPPAPSANVVPIRPKPPTFPPLSAVARPIIIEEDIVEYLVKASVEQRWKILSRVAMATIDEPVPLTPSPLPPRSETSTLPPPAPPALAPANNVDASEELFQAMHELMQLGSEAEGARFCLEAALRGVPCLAGLVLLRDAAMGDSVVVHAKGPRADRLLRTRAQVDGPMTRAAQAGKPTVVTYGSEPGAEPTLCARHALFEPWSAALAPVMHGGQLVALLELIDPIDGNPFDGRALATLGYVAMRLGRFLAAQASQA